MHREIWPETRPAITAQALCARPATAEQALDMLGLMVADMVAGTDRILSGWAERFPIDDEEPAHAMAQLKKSQDILSIKTQAYIAKHGKLDVPLAAMGGNTTAIISAIKMVTSKIAEDSAPEKTDCEK